MITCTYKMYNGLDYLFIAKRSSMNHKVSLSDRQTGIVKLALVNVLTNSQKLTS